MKENARQLAESVSSALALSAKNTGATGDEMMEALAMVSMVTHVLHAPDMRDEEVAEIFGAIALEMDPVS